ncbi:MAG: electron transfer flavoprotein subunit beta/FixA family protein [Sediminibacterium sp.]
MNILVCISKTPDTTAKIAFSEGNTKFDENGVQWIINPYDEWYSLIRAIEIKEQDPSTLIHLITVGGPEVEPIIRKALALGGDEAIRVDINSNDSYVIAQQIATVAKQGSYDLIMTGKETIDYNSACIGSMLSAILDLPFVSLANHLTINGNTASVQREIEGGEETNEVNLPLVISCQKGMAEQRIPNMRGIMAARTKPLKIVAPIEAHAHTSIKTFSLPPEKTGVKLIAPDEMNTLVKLLKEEAKVI